MGQQEHRMRHQRLFFAQHRERRQFSNHNSLTVSSNQTS